MNKDIYDGDAFKCEHNVDTASQLHTHYRKSDFLYKRENQLYRCKVKARGGLKIKNLCTAYPELIKVINQGTTKEPKWHYLFKLYSDFTKIEHEILMSPKNLSSNLTFKRALLINAPGVIFTGSKDDFDMFISAVFHENSDYLSNITNVIG